MLRYRVIKSGNALLIDFGYQSAGSHHYTLGTAEIKLAAAPGEAPVSLDIPRQYRDTSTICVRRRSTQHPTKSTMGDGVLYTSQVCLAATGPEAEV